MTRKAATLYDWFNEAGECVYPELSYADAKFILGGSLAGLTRKLSVSYVTHGVTSPQAIADSAITHKSD
jgi:hypothetical protein